MGPAEMRRARIQATATATVTLQLGPGSLACVLCPAVYYALLCSALLCSAALRCGLLFAIEAVR